MSSLKTKTAHQSVICEAFYLPSNITSGIIKFEIELEWEQKDTKEGFEHLFKAFTIAVNGFGKTQLFPKEILDQTQGEGHRLDRLLSDTEFIPERTYYLKIRNQKKFYSLENVEAYQLIGINKTYCMLERFDKNVINVVQITDVMKVFEEEILQVDSP